MVILYITSTSFSVYSILYFCIAVPPKYYETNVLVYVNYLCITVIIAK